MAWRGIAVAMIIIVACLIAASDGNTAAANSGLTIGAGKDWAQPTGDYANTRYSSLSQIMDFLDRRPTRS